MSQVVNRWASAQTAPNARAKCVLLLLSHFVRSHSADWLASPSIDDIARISQLSHKAVLKAIGCLCDAGLLEDAGQRRGRVEKVIVWRLMANDDDKVRLERADMLAEDAG